MMVDLEDDPEWSIQDEIEDEDEESNPITGESAMDRLACALGGKTMLPHILTNVNSMLSHGKTLILYIYIQKNITKLTSIKF